MCSSKSRKNRNHNHQLSTINYQRVFAVVLRQWYEFTNQWSRLFDTFFWPIIDLLLWGLTFFYIEATTPEISLSKVIIGALIFSSFLYSVQRDFTIGFLQDVWDRNLYNIFSAPLRKGEIILGSSITTITKMLFLSVLMTAVAYVIYDFNFLEFLPLVAGGITNITLFGIFFGLLTTGFIFQFGSQVQTLTWSGLGILMPVLCIYYPVAALPEWLQPVAWALPPTWVFEYVRNFVNTQTIPTFTEWLWPLFLNILYLILSLWYFNKAFRNAHQRGWFVKMD